MDKKNVYNNTCDFFLVRWWFTRIEGKAASRPLVLRVVNSTTTKSQSNRKSAREKNYLSDII